MKIIRIHIEAKNVIFDENHWSSKIKSKKNILKR